MKPGNDQPCTDDQSRPGAVDNSTGEMTAPHTKSSSKPDNMRFWDGFFRVRASKPSEKSNQRTRHKSKGLPVVDQSLSESPATKASSEDNSVASQKGQDQDQEHEAAIAARLGKSELGKFAHENRMPPSLVNLLHREGQVINVDAMPTLRQLLENSSSTQFAYLCHPKTQHISKLKREGGFCGYRNIQMLVSHIIGAQNTGSDHFGSDLPTIFDIQDLIEMAWDKGFNAKSRQETGGIKGTRKYIGTPEAQAVFRSLDIPCSVKAFKSQDEVRAHTLLLESTEELFRDCAGETDAKVLVTNLPPIYFQHAGHSMTIVGVEKQQDGQANLLVFDPGFQGTNTIGQLPSKVFRGGSGDGLRRYRRGPSYLRKYGEFELLCLTDRVASP